MKTKRTIELTVETLSISMLRGITRPSVFVWCEPCGAHVQMSTPEAAAIRAGLSVRAVYQKVESQAVHFMEMPDSSVLICLDSIS